MEKEKEYYVSRIIEILELEKDYKLKVELENTKTYFVRCRKPAFEKLNLKIHTQIIVWKRYDSRNRFKDFKLSYFKTFAHLNISYKDYN